MESLPKTMRSLFQPDPSSTALRLIESPVPTPKPGTSEHLIRVHAASPCAGELHWSKYVPLDPTIKELVPCSDIAGTVLSGPDDSPFKPGDEVYARITFERTGAAREYAVVLGESLAHRAKKLSWAESAALPLSALTAWQALFVQSAIGDFNSLAWNRKRVLVTAAAGGVGAWVVQLAHLVGAEVVGTCGPKNVDFVRSLGASEVIDYTKDTLKDWANDKTNKVDLFIDCVGQKSMEDAWWAVKDHGTIISICHPPEDVRPTELVVEDVKTLWFIMKPDGKQLTSLTDLVDAGKCRPFVDSVWPLEQYEEAFSRLDSRHARGKVILDLFLNRP